MTIPGAYTLLILVMCDRYGAIGLIGHLAFYALMGTLIAQRRVRDVMGKENVAFGIWFLAVIFVLNYKEPFFFARMSYPISLAAIMGLYWLTPRPRKMSTMTVPHAAPSVSLSMRRVGGGAQFE
jgi:hypothetical protein